MPRDAQPSQSESVAATAPGESGWSAQTLMDAFGKKLPWWLRKMGVHDNEIEDAFQEVFIEVLNELHKIPADSAEAKEELIRLASRVACRRKRAMHRNELHVSDIETHDPINREDWIATRMLWAEAINVLDERAKKLFIAHDIEGRSYASIAAEMGEKEDTIEKRGAKVKARLRAEILRLLGKDAKRNGTPNSSLAFIFGLSAFDRALFRTLFELDEQHSPAPPISSVRPSVPTGWTSSGVSMAVLVGVMLMLPAKPSSSTGALTATMSDLSLPTIVVKTNDAVQGSALDAIPGSTLPKGTAIPRKTHAAPLPTLDKATRASLPRVTTHSL